MNITTELLLLVGVGVLAGGVSIALVADRVAVGIAAARTAAQTATGLTLAALVAGDGVNVSTSVLIPTLIAALTVVHGAAQPPVRSE